MARLRHAWHSWRRHSWAQRGLGVRAWLLLPLAVSGLRLFGFRRTQTMLLRGGGAPRRIDLSAAQDAARLLTGAAAWSAMPASCLARALVLSRLLRNQGLAAELRIGVARVDGQFIAHAWVEHGGTALIEAEDVGARYVVFDEPLLVGG
jgi:hypothetical protein